MTLKRVLSAGLALNLIGSVSAWAEVPSGPALALRVEGVPQLTVTGTPGQHYQIEWTAALSASNRWQVWTNLLLEQERQTILDDSPVAAAQRFYRALLLVTEAGRAPEQLAPGESFRFLSQDGAMQRIETLAVSSAGSGVWVREGTGPESGLSEVNLQYQRLGPYSGELRVVRPGRPEWPMPETNVYWLIFTSAGTGLFQASGGPTMTVVGDLEWNRSLVGQDPAIAPPQAGEVFQFVATNAGQSFSETLVVTSESAGLLIRPEPSSEKGLSLVSLHHTSLGPLSARLEVEVVWSGNPMVSPSEFSSYRLVYTGTDRGSYQAVGADGGGSSPTLGHFERNRSLVGQTVAEAAPLAGESYRFRGAEVDLPRLESLVVNSVSNGLRWTDGPPPEASLREVGMQYARFGALWAHLALTWPSYPSMPGSTTTSESCLLVFTGSDHGWFQVWDGTSVRVGEFERDQSLVGQELAPAGLEGGQNVSFTFIEAGLPGGTTLLVNSQTDGLLWPQGAGLDGGPVKVNLRYTRLGPRGAELEVVQPPNGPMPMARTNGYLMVFNSTDTGLFQTSGATSVPLAGGFEWNRSLVGQELAATPLAVGEVLELAATNTTPATTETLVVTGENTGLLIRPEPSPECGISVVNWRYSCLGPSSAQLDVEVVWAGNPALPLPDLRSYVLIYAGTNAGGFQAIGESGGGAMPTAGHFGRNSSLVGQTVAGPGLVAGESYRFALSTAGTFTTQTLVVNSSSNGLLLSEGQFPAAGLSEVVLRYARLWPWCARLDWSWPESLAGAGTATESPLLVYTAMDQGWFQVWDGVTLRVGEFHRNQSLVGRETRDTLEGEGFALNLPNVLPGSLELRDALGQEYHLGLDYTVLLQGATTYLRVLPGSRLLSELRSGGKVLIAYEADTAQAQLTAGQVFWFVGSQAGLTWAHVLVLNSPTDGLLLRQGNGPDSTLTAVGVCSTHLGLRSSSLEVIQPPGGPDPMARTNGYRLAYLTTNAGLFQATTEPAITLTGQFQRDESLVGQEVAQNSLRAGEVFYLATLGAAAGWADTLVVNSPTEGLLLRQGTGAESGLALVSLRFTRLGPLAASLEMIQPATGPYPTPRTNVYRLAYTSATGGFFQVSAEPAMTLVGHFQRDQSLVGQEVAQTTLRAGEVYRLVSAQTGITAADTLVVNSPTDGLLLRQGTGPDNSLAAVSLRYTRLGPSGALIEAVPSANGLDPMPRTNLYLLLYTSASGGSFQNSAEPAMTLTGQFQRDQSLVGQEVAQSTLRAGEVFWLASSGAGIGSSETLVINSPTEGLLARQGAGVGSGLAPVSLRYTRLGPLGASLEAVLPAGGPDPMPRTNLYLLAYVSTNGGVFQVSAQPVATLTGPFQRDQSLVGQEVAPAQLRAGEVFLLATFGNDTLVVTSPTDGLLLRQTTGLDSSLAAVSLRYRRLGPLGALIEAIQPADAPYSMPRTNLYLMAYTSPAGGSFQLSAEPAMTLTGAFQRDQSLVGQTVATPQLIAGEVYGFTLSPAWNETGSVLVVNSPTDGFLARLGSAPSSGLAAVNLQYTADSPVSARLQAIYPSAPAFPQPRTNSYVLVYVTSSGGFVQATEEPMAPQFGSFSRTRP